MPGTNPARPPPPLAGLVHTARLSDCAPQIQPIYLSRRPANAYAYATGGSANRSRGDVPESPVEKFVGDVFAIVGIEADYSAIKAVQRDIKRPDAL